VNQWEMYNTYWWLSDQIARHLSPGFHDVTSGPASQALAASASAAAAVDPAAAVTAELWPTLSSSSSSASLSSSSVLNVDLEWLSTSSFVNVITSYGHTVSTFDMHNIIIIVTKAIPLSKQELDFFQEQNKNFIFVETKTFHAASNLSMS